MRSLPFSLLTLALLPLAASLLVLAAGHVSTGLWGMHGVSMALAGAVALTSFFWRRFAQQRVAVAMIVLTLLSLTAPLLGASSGPERWLQLGPLRLYMAPLWLPSFLAACAYAARGGKRHETGGLVAILGAGLALAVQPDFSQVLALLAGAAVLLTRFRAGAGRVLACLMALALLTTWAFWLPDPLQPVPHVEGVFALVWGESRVAGLAVMAGALAWIGGLLVQAHKGPFWLAAVAAYYSVLLLCSLWGLTPAPLLGYGAGPILGFGLLVAVSGAFTDASKRELKRGKIINMDILGVNESIKRYLTKKAKRDTLKTSTSPISDFKLPLQSEGYRPIASTRQVAGGSRKNRIALSG